MSYSLQKTLLAHQASLRTELTGLIVKNPLVLGYWTKLSLHTGVIKKFNSMITT